MNAMLLVLTTLIAMLMNHVDCLCVKKGKAPFCGSESKLTQQCYDQGLAYCFTEKDNCKTGKKVQCCDLKTQCPKLSDANLFDSVGTAEANAEGAVSEANLFDSVSTVEANAEGYAYGPLTTVALLLLGVGIASVSVRYCQKNANPSYVKLSVYDTEDEERAFIN
mmetsp:Transcript_5717/g.9220  ORF Transcript_5717/g.9220 Transcript_5717/m.9220 type:complete len:165 (+) Transcript_5717:72-566(+)|eukprot:CAMPEP_0202687808 /NCGR_PEP_ID=MMETSP1385-20130828/3416_1 /ASSEMBLY_ACC=CAM_ASM_000861 /TAXON_ID=933848 /ORGANISM="Elphidium margaritaceum" /LENGTH=164 /DNA_ID=CAMNT_0049342657 /DNA_START=70 /DNA_END=564 /DNA_ORIENTATION=+